ncbi:MAG: aminotransferase class V-fold PLP-dependent enzyme [Phycisphaerales bacterium]
MPRPTPPRPAPLASHWRLDPDVTFLNHGSFGAVPFVVSEYQRELQLLVQREPVRFYVELMESMVDAARLAVAPLLGCAPDDFGFVLNATMGVNAVIRSLPFQPGDEILTSNHEYNACNNVVEWAAQRLGVNVVKVDLPFPISGPDEAFDRIVAGVTTRTRLVLISHITSPSGMVLPVERVTREMNRRGIDTLIDGAHAPGMVPLDIDRLGAPFYTGNLHKWVCAPNGAAFLHVRPDRQHLIRPTIISHGANSPRTDRSRFRLEFDYIGTNDPSAWLSVPAAVTFMSRIGAALDAPPEHPGPSASTPDPLRQNWERVMRSNRHMALKGREILGRALGVEPCVPDDMIGSLAAVMLPPARPGASPAPSKYHDPLQDVLIRRYGIQVPIYPVPAPIHSAGAPPGARVVRISAQVYNSTEQYEFLALALKHEL